MFLRTSVKIKRRDLELTCYIGDGAQDLVLDLSMRHYRGGAAPRNWGRNGELLHPDNPTGQGP